MSCASWGVARPASQAAAKAGSLSASRSVPTKTAWAASSAAGRTAPLASRSASAAPSSQTAGAESAALMRRPFSGPDRDGLRKLLADAGFGETQVHIGGFLARFASPREFLRQQVVSSPLAGPVGELDEDRRDALRHHLDQALEPWTDDDGVVVPLQTWLVTACRQG